MKIHLACGGTGGHIFPGLATADALKDRGHDVTLWMAGKDVESTAVHGWQGPVITVPSEGFSSLLSARSFRTLWKLVKAVRDCRRRMAADRPEVLLAMGSYASVGPSLAAFGLKVPVVLHEANVVPGRAIAVLSRRADSVAAAFEETRFYLRRKKIVVTGMPLRRDLVKRRLELGTAPVSRDGPFTIMIMGGSRGARRLNELAVEALTGLGPSARAIHAIHLTGPADVETVRSQYDEFGLSHETRAFVQDMASVYARAQLAVCRAGAATCAELCLFGIPSLLVPYPYAARNHQFANARMMEKAGAADAVEEKDLESDWLVEYIRGNMQKPSRMARMREAAGLRGRADAAEALADEVERTAHAGRS